MVVQLALETISMSDVYSFSLTPTTNIGASLLGAEIITFFAPPYMTNRKNIYLRGHAKLKERIFQKRKRKEKFSRKKK